MNENNKVAAVDCEPDGNFVSTSVSETGAGCASLAELMAACRQRDIPVRFDGVITASGLAKLLDYGPDTVRKWRDEGKGPRYRIAPWRGHRFTYALRDVAAWLDSEKM